MASVQKLTALYVNNLCFTEKIQAFPYMYCKIYFKSSYNLSQLKCTGTIHEVYIILGAIVNLKYIQRHRV